MTDASNTDAKKSKKSALSFLAWWKTDPAEVEKQATQYRTLKVWQSARGISSLLCVFSVVATVFLGRMISLSAGTILAEAIIWSSLGVFMYRGHRWAFILGMILWTIEKATLLFAGASAGAAPIVQIIWWTIYMSAFFLAFKVESRRAVLSLAPAL